MREILFRGRDVKRDVWEYGDLLRNANGKSFIRKEYEGVDIFIEVYPETVGQYTGLKDYNGQMIYEGDILQDMDDATLLKVEWDEASFCALELNGCDRYGANEMTCFEVIGYMCNDSKL